MATFGKFRAIFLLSAADLVHGLVDDFHDVKFVECDLRLGEVFPDSGYERLGHVAAGFLDTFSDHPPCSEKSCLKRSTVEESLPSVAKRTVRSFRSTNRLT